MRHRSTPSTVHGDDSRRCAEGRAAYQILESLRSPHVRRTMRRLLLLRLEVLVASGETPGPGPFASSLRGPRTGDG